MFLTSNQPPPILPLAQKKASHEQLWVFKDANQALKMEGGKHEQLCPSCAEYHLIEIVKFFEATFSVFVLIILHTTTTSVSTEWLVLQPPSFSWKPELTLWVLQVHF